MTNQLTELLEKLSELEPEVCRHKYTAAKATCFEINATEIWVSNDGLLKMSVDGCDEFLGDEIARPWLRGAIERAIEARGWDYSDHTSVTQGRYHFAAIYNKPGSLEAVHSPNEHITTSAHALLAAFVAACGASKDGGR